MIVVDQQGENTIVVAAGANGGLTGSMVKSNQRQILSSTMLLVQLEVRFSAVIEAVRIANRAGIPVVLNASPIRDDLPWEKWQLDTVIINESEAQALFGPKPWKISDRFLAKKGVETLIITRGAKSTIVVSRFARLEIPTAKIQPVDTVGAGDAFTGTYVSRRAEGSSVASAVCHANCAGALATLKFGAQESIPTRRDTEKLWIHQRQAAKPQ
jgi:ribokinase